MDEQVVGQRHPRRKVGGSDDLHAHDVMDTPGCGRVPSVAGSTVHTRRRLAAMVLLTLLGAALIVALDRRGGQERPQSALGPSVIGGVAAAQPFNYVPAQRAAYERDAALGLSHVLFAKSPGGVVASARRTAHWRPIVDRVATRPRARRRHARGDRHARVGRAAPTRARPTTCARPRA